MLDLYFLIEFPIFRDFDADDVEALAGVCSEAAYAAGAAVVAEGEAGDAMYVVKSGVLEVSRKVGGAAKAINLLSAGEFFGEMALIDNSPRSADVSAKEAAVLIKLPAEAYQRLKKEKPATALKIADVLLKTLSFRVRRSTTRALQSESAPAPATPTPASPDQGRGRIHPARPARAGDRPAPSAGRPVKRRAKRNAKRRTKRAAKGHARPKRKPPRKRARRP